MTVALLGAAIGLALTPFAPAGVPVIAASAAALLGLLPGDDRGPKPTSPRSRGTPLADVWPLVGLLIVTTAVIRRPGRCCWAAASCRPACGAVIALTAPALLAALVATETFGGEGSELAVDERALGVAAAGGALALRGSDPGGVIVAMAVTAGARALG